MLSFYSFAVKVLPDRDNFAEDTLLWDKALQKWLQVFEVLGFSWNAWFLRACRAGAWCDWNSE